MAVPPPSIEIGSLAQWVAAGATFLAVIVALLKEEIVRLWRRPQLAASIKLGPPDSHKTSLTILGNEVFPPKSIPCYYFNLWIENKGKARAEKVQVFAAELSRRFADGTFRPVEDFQPMNLRWSHTHEIFAEGISPPIGKHCDLGHISVPSSLITLQEDHPDAPPGKTVLALELEAKPNTKSHLLPPGTYILTLRIAGANCSPVTMSLEITITGDWYDEQDRMFRDGVGIRML